MDYIPLEKPVAELEIKIEKLKQASVSQSINLDKEISELSVKASKLREKLFAQLTPYESVQLSRHPMRPNTLELIQMISSEFVELHGDRNFFDDKSIVGGLARINLDSGLGNNEGSSASQSVVIIGHQKGRGTKGNIERNFGMPKPEGYRKALRLMSLAERFKKPIITLIDTPGAYPGIGAEERGQSEAIGKNILVMGRLMVPIISIVIGEGGSGGALALGVANRVHMLKYAIYSVISPEGCASILMKDAGKAAQAAEALRLTAADALKLGVIDSIIDEPTGGAHRSVETTASNIKQRILKDLNELGAMSGEELKSQRQEKFMELGSSTYVQ